MPLHIRTARPSGVLKGLTLDCDLTIGYSSKQTIKIEDTVGIVFEDAIFDGEFVLHYNTEKVMVLKKVGTGETPLKCQKAYWDPADGLWTATGATGLWWAGIFVRDATLNAIDVMIDLKGDKATLFAEHA